MQRAPCHEGGPVLLEAVPLEHRVEGLVVVAMAHLALSIQIGPRAQLQGILRRPVVGELRREALEVLDALVARATREGIGLIEHAPGDAGLPAAVVRLQGQLRMLGRHPADPCEGAALLPVGVVAQRATLQGRRLEVVRKCEPVAVEHAPGDEDVEIASGAGDRRLTQKLIALARIGGQAAVDPLLAPAGADLEHAPDRPVAVQHRAVAVGELDVTDHLRRNQSRVELPVLSAVHGDPVHEQQHVAGAKPPHVDPRRAVGAGADHHTGLVHQRLVQRSRALLANVLLVDPPGRRDVLHQVARRGDGLLVDGSGRRRASAPRSRSGRDRPGRDGQYQPTPQERVPSSHHHSPTPRAPAQNALFPADYSQSPWGRIRSRTASRGRCRPRRSSLLDAEVQPHGDPGRDGLAAADGRVEARLSECLAHRSREVGVGALHQPAAGHRPVRENDHARLDIPWQPPRTMSATTRIDPGMRFSCLVLLATTAARHSMPSETPQSSPGSSGRGGNRAGRSHPRRSHLRPSPG